MTNGAQQSSGLMADQGLSVMSLGGFMGTDPAASTDSIGHLLQAGDVRYFYAPFIQRGPDHGVGPAVIMRLVQAGLPDGSRPAAALVRLGVRLRRPGRVVPRHAGQPRDPERDRSARPTFSAVGSVADQQQLLAAALLHDRFHRHLHRARDRHGEQAPSQPKIVTPSRKLSSTTSGLTFTRLAMIAG